MDDLSKEQIGPHTTVLDYLNKLLDPEDPEELLDLHDIMITNRHVIQAGLKPTMEQFREYFQQIRIGFEYLKNTYGLETLPRRLGFHLFADSQDSVDWIGYFPEEDELGISYLHMAGQCAYYNHPNAIFIENGRLPHGNGVRAKDFTTLQAIEEGYHRYQLRVLGLTQDGYHEDQDDRFNHPLETGIIPVFQKATEDLNIQTYPIYKKSE
jgi:hypothetical protein